MHEPKKRQYTSKPTRVFATMRGLWLLAALCATGAHADKPREKKQPKPKKQKEQKKNCPACPADLAGELAAATARYETAEAKTCPADLSDQLAASEQRAAQAEGKERAMWEVKEAEIAKVLEAQADAAHWKAQAAGLEDQLQATKTKLETSKSEPVVPGVSISHDGTVAFNATDGLLAAQETGGQALRMAGEAVSTGYRAFVDAIPTEEAKKLGADAVAAVHGAVDAGKAKGGEVYDHAWGFMIDAGHVSPTTKASVEAKVGGAHAAVSEVVADVCYVKLPALYDQHAERYVDAALVEMSERKDLAQVELRELSTHLRATLAKQVGALKAKVPSKGEIRRRADLAREIVAIRFHGVLVAAGACDDAYDQQRDAYIGEPCAPARRLSSACVACWTVAFCVLLAIGSYHVVAMLFGLAKGLVIAGGKRVVRLPLMVLRLGVALVAFALLLALKLALLPLRILLLPVTLPLAMLARKKGPPAKAPAARAPRKNSPGRVR